MKKTMIGMLLIAAQSTLAAVATVQQIEPGVRPVHNSGTGIMPPGAQESMPKARRQLARDNMVGIGFSPFMLAFLTPIQLPSEDFDVGGLRLNILCGTCCNFDGLDAGLVGISRNHANGLLFNVVSVTQGDGLGLQAGGVNHLSGDFKGMQFGVANWSAYGDVFQVGGYNGGYDIQGLQIGVINTANKLQGLQIGLVNIISNSDLSFFPIINGMF